MEHIELEVLVEVMTSAFTRGKTFSFTPYGNSMLPTIQNGTDTVTLAPPDKLDIGDVVFYRRPSGMYVMHRIVGKLHGGFMLCGDNENIIEYPIFPSAVLAKAIDAKTADGQNINLHEKRMVHRLWFKKLKLIIKKSFARK